MNYSGSGSRCPSATRRNQSHRTGVLTQPDRCQQFFPPPCAWRLVFTPFPRLPMETGRSPIHPGGSLTGMARFPDPSRPHCEEIFMTGGVQWHRWKKHPRLRTAVCVPDDGLSPARWQCRCRTRPGHQQSTSRRPPDTVWVLSDRLTSGCPITDQQPTIRRDRPVRHDHPGRDSARRSTAAAGRHPADRLVHQQRVRPVSMRLPAWWCLDQTVSLLVSLTEQHQVFQPEMWGCSNPLPSKLSADAID
jgi:hypothetical protein